MQRKLLRLCNEATRLYTVYEEHKDSSDDFMRRKVHVDLDRFLMKNREVAAMLMISGLQAELAKPAPWYRRWLKGGIPNVNNKNTFSQ